MQFIVSINQTKALEWGLNAQQALLFAYLHQVPTWATARQIDGVTWFNCGKGKVVEELPILTDKQDTVYRLMKQLRDAGLIDMTSTDNKTFIRLTAKGIEWNKAGSEKSPTLGNKSEQGRKNIRQGSEKSPTNQDTNINNPSLSGADDASEPSQSIFERAKHLDDSGKPLTAGADQLPMSLDWVPDQQTLAVECHRRGLSMETQYTAAELADFTAFFADSGKRFGAHAWVARFARWIHENRRREAARNQNTASTTAKTGGNHANRQQRPRQLRTAQEARAAAQRESGQQPAGQTFDGDWSQGNG
ncbi:DnaT-like ssDNA-binding domain-containing protein [Kushneria sp. Sum13]|uniref:DnaT-like ssDNA-binding domain-containing protein n=1 Tax=Kushneria sp. Sum13 TaxID=3459196 RepID=UPI0040465BCD